MSLTEKLNITLKNEKKKRESEISNNLENVYIKLRKYNMYSKTEYTLPIKDIIGKEYFKQPNFQVS